MGRICSDFFEFRQVRTCSVLEELNSAFSRRIEVLPKHCSKFGNFWQVRVVRSSIFLGTKDVFKGRRVWCSENLGFDPTLNSSNIIIIIPNIILGNLKGHIKNIQDFMNLVVYMNENYLWTLIIKSKWLNWNASI